MNIIRKAFKIFNGSSWDEYHLKTDSKQVIHTKADGTDTTVEEQLLALYSTMNRKSKSVSVRTDASIPYYANEFICVNRTNADVTTPNVGTFSTSGLFTFAEDMTALFVASISGRPDSTGRIWLNLVRYSDNYKYDSNIIYGGYATCTFNTVIKAKKGEQIALGTVEKFQMNSGGFASNMAVIRLD